MAIVRAIVTLPWTTGLPEDVTVNTFHFTTSSNPPSAGQLDTIDTQLIAFYNTSSGVAGNDIAGYLSNLVDRTADFASIKTYDLADPEPRTPLRTTTFTLGAADAATSAPTEVALCLSFRGVPLSGEPPARRRGRVFLGPWNAAVLTTGGRPLTALVTSVAGAGNFLHDSLNVGVTEVRWAIWSPTSGDSVEVDNGWCDDEWDTMRSRGRRATFRTTFS